MVLADDASAHAAISGLDSAEYSTPFGAESRWRGDVLTSLQLETAVTTGKVAYDDYNLKRRRRSCWSKLLAADRPCSAMTIRGAL
jgi:hypothetical protein